MLPATVKLVPVETLEGFDPDNVNVGGVNVTLALEIVVVPTAIPAALPPATTDGKVPVP